MAVNLLAGMQYVQQQGELGRQQGLERRYNRLAGQAFNAPDTDSRNAAIGQIAVNNPDAATQLRAQYEGEDDRKIKLVAGAAKYMKTALDSGNQQAIAGAWRAVRPGLINAGLATEQELSPDWQDDYAQTVHQVLAAGGGGSAPTNPYEGLPSDIQSLRLLQDNPQLAALDRERRQAAGMVPKQMQTSQGWGWGTPGGGIELAPITGIAGQGDGQQPRQAAPAPQLFAALGQKYGIQPTSVTRTPERNREVGGVTNSYHLSGQAADWAVPQQYKAQFMADARANGFEAIDEGDHIHIEPAGSGRGAQRPTSPMVMDPVDGGIAQPYQAPQKTEPESFGQPQAVVNPQTGKRELVQFGNRGGVRRVGEYAPEAAKGEGTGDQANDGLNDRQRVAVKGVQRNLIQYAAALTGIPAEQLQGMSAQDIAEAVQSKGGRFVQGGVARVMGNFPGGQTTAQVQNSDILSYSQGAGAAWAAYENPTGIITNADRETATAQMPNYLDPPEVQAAKIRSFLELSGWDGRGAQQAPSALPSGSSGWGIREIK